MYGCSFLNECAGEKCQTAACRTVLCEDDGICNPVAGERVLSQRSRPSSSSSAFVRADACEVPQLTTAKFMFHHAKQKSVMSSWRRRYFLGRELGAGQTATVFEGFSAAPLTDASRIDPGRKGRKVAIKCYHKNGSSMFKRELKALKAVGTHPSVLRLLESFSSDREGDVIVLEYCDGGDLYDFYLEFYASQRGNYMPEARVSQILCQIVEALRHMHNNGVEHRDLKPENILLQGSSDTSALPQLKLGDFGWAYVVEPADQFAEVFPEVAGSVWYAPPELNPSPKGVDTSNLTGKLRLGMCDMWSVGVIAYLLLTGTSPFTDARRVEDPMQRDLEVVRLAALGKINQQCKGWTSSLSDHAKDFICSLLQAQSWMRPSTQKLMAHPFLLGAQPMQSPQPKIPSLPEVSRAKVWAQMDGFQRLSWLALARAVGESELSQLGLQLEGSKDYLEQLAKELLFFASASWFEATSMWSDVVYLAYRYLDSDEDGLLSVDDLSVHMVQDGVGPIDQQTEAEQWIAAWSLPGDLLCLSYSSFRRAASAICVRGGGSPRVQVYPRPGPRFTASTASLEVSPERSEEAAPAAQLAAASGHDVTIHSSDGTYTLQF